MRIRNLRTKFSLVKQSLCPHRLQKNNESVQPFVEKPGRGTRKEQTAIDLFESFTASIIQENRVFVR